MIVRYLLAALVAGLLAGALQTVVQQAKVVPLILEAEKYEGGAMPEKHDHTTGLNLSIVTKASAHTTDATTVAGEEEESGMLFGPNRTVNTLMAELVTGTGYALLLIAASLLFGQPVTLANGAIWGGVAWLSQHLLPAIGLPPELPGFPAADLFDRQMWWVGTVIASAVGFYLIILRKEPWLKAVGVVLLIVPHVIGAPQAANEATNVPAILAAEFAVAALSAGLLFWLMIGLIMGAINDRWLKTA